MEVRIPYPYVSGYNDYNHSQPCLLNIILTSGNGALYAKDEVLEFRIPKFLLYPT